LPSPDYPANVVSSLATAADEAKKHGISMAIECINRYENSFINTVSQGLSLLRQIGRDNMGLHLDTYHMNIEELSIPLAIAEAGKKIKRIHLSENNRGYPGNGALPWNDIILAVKGTGYEGPWIVESYVDPAFPASSDVSVWRKIEPDMLSSLRRSLDFLRGLIGKE
jgi:D-psicose/D-tagatose/L-ribulose 3-epimerase